MSARFISFIVLTCSLLSVPSFVFADPVPEGHEPLFASERTPHSDVHVGDMITWTISVVVPEHDDIQMQPPSLQGVQVRRRTIRQDSIQNGKQTFIITIELMAFQSGELNVGPLPVQVITQDGRVGTAEVPPFHVRVISWIANEPNAQLKPATSPVIVREPDPTWKYVSGTLGAMLVGAIIGLLLYRWWKRRPKPALPPAPPRPPWEIAIEKLDKLRLSKQTMLEQGQWSMWIDGVSDAVRAYLGARYGFDGLESTTDEIIRRLRNASLGLLVLPEIETFLGDCDLIKFAKVEPTQEKADVLLALSYRIVQSTRPYTSAIQTQSTPYPFGGANS